MSDERRDERKAGATGAAKGSTATGGAEAAGTSRTPGRADDTTKERKAGTIGDFGLNDRAWAIADDMAANAAELRIVVSHLPSGARVIDAGVDLRGGLGAGLGLAQLTMGGLGNISITSLLIGDTPYSGVRVWTDQPAIACVASQYAGWSIRVDDFFALGSGPLRAHARVERELFDKLGYAERATHGVLVLEGRKLPDDAVAAHVAERSRLAPSALTFAIAPTASLAGGVQVAARSVETGLHKMQAVGFDIHQVISGVGTAPIPPVAKDDLRAIGRTNDCVLYGCETRFTIDASDDELEELARTLPASSSSDYGTPFYEIFKRYDGDFYKIDPHLFSPGEVWLSSAASGRTFHGGKLNPDILKKSLLES